MSDVQTTPSIKTLHGRNAAARRWNRPDRDEIAREYATARIEDYIKRVVADAPPLTVEQQDRLASILRGRGRLAG